MENPPAHATCSVQPAATAPVITTKEWLINFLLIAIPIAGLVMLIIWACSDTENPTKRNFARAQLIWMGIVLVLVIAFYITLFLVFGVFAAAASQATPSTVTP